MGEYREGLRVGVWTRFYPTGSVRAQIEFREGLQHGWLLTFDEDGRRTRAVRYAEGVVAP
jgi:antitoxin component YwqK of YwqJK toxin-antitoxin module